MHITYRDTLGIMLCEVNEYGIAFGDGKAYFSDAEGRDYAIPMENLIEIQHA